MAVLESTARANAALDELYREHVGDVYRYTYAVLGNHADAEDVTQTTFVNALRALERGERPDDPSRWLIVIAHNLVRQRWRQAAARPTLVELEADVPDATGDDAAHELEELVRALQRIPETQREALVMRELEGRSYRDIAAVLGLSTSALETLLFRARRSLADELENVVTCQNAELSISRRLDGRLSRKERRRLEEHLADCPDCARLAAMESRQRKALKGLALLPLPVGLALFKGVPTASAAASLPTIGLAAADAGAKTATGAAGAGAAGAGSTAGGSAAAGTLAGGIALKVAAVAATVVVAAGVGYKGAQVLRDSSSAQPATDAAPTAKQATAIPRAPVVVQPKQSAKPRVTAAPPHPATKATTKQGQATRSASTPAQPDTATVPSAHGTAPPATTVDTTVSPIVTHPAAPPKTPTTAEPASGSGGAQNAPAPQKPAPTPAKPAPAKPTAPKAPVAGTGGASATSPTPGGGSPDTGTSGSSGATSPATPPPAAAGSPSATPTTPSTPPVTTPPATTPPAATPPTTTPPADSTPPSTPPTGDTSGSSDPGSSSDPSSHGANPLERGLKLGLHKDENPDGHPSHP
jgi:RNA polymerase sigma factor (sigma-70 family)